MDGDSGHGGPPNPRLGASGVGQAQTCHLRTPGIPPSWAHCCSVISCSGELPGEVVSEECEASGQPATFSLTSRSI